MAALPQQKEAQMPISMLSEDVYMELRDFRKETNDRFKALHTEVDAIKRLTVTHIQECDARKGDMDELLKESREARIWREINSKKFGKVKKAAAYITGSITVLATLVSSIVYLWSVFRG